MKIKSYILCFLVFISCSKQKTFDFPKGDWKLVKLTYEVDGPKTNQTGLNVFIDKFDSKSFQECNLKYDGNKKLFFLSNDSKDYFTINNLEIRKDSAYFSSEINENLSGANSYKLSLRNKLGKVFVFEYYLINDTTLIGEFWTKGQNYVRFDAPNIQDIVWESTNSNENISFTREILGVYHLQK